MSVTKPNGHLYVQCLSLILSIPAGQFPQKNKHGLQDPLSYFPLNLYVSVKFLMNFPAFDSPKPKTGSPKNV